MSVFSGKSNADTLFSVKEYGNSCILYAMDKILEYGDAINIIQVDERGRGVPKIVGAYGRESIRIEKNFIVVTIPFNRINVTPFELNEGVGSDVPNGSVKSSVKGSVKSSVKIIEMMKENPEITIPMIAEMLHKTTRAIEKSIAKLQSNGFVKRVGPDKGGHWEIMN